MKKAKKIPMKDLVTFAKICEQAGVKEADYDMPKTGNAKQMLDATLTRQLLIAKVLNDGKKAKVGERMYYPFDEIIMDDAAPRGFRLSFVVFSYADVYASLGARPVLVDAEKCNHYGKYFEAERVELLYWTVEANNE